MPRSTGTHTVAQHFTDRAPAVKATYAAVLKAARRLGPFAEDPKKTSIHLNRKSAFAGVSTRKEALLLTLKAGKDIKSPRVEKREQHSAGRWYVVVRLESPAEVDKQLAGWLAESYELSG